MWYHIAKGRVYFKKHLEQNKSRHAESTWAKPAFVLTLFNHMTHSHPPTSCSLCHSHQIEIFFSISDMPTQDGLLAPSKAAAHTSPVGDIVLSLCRTCGYVANEGYETDKITFDTYDFSLNHSPVFAEYVESTTDRLLNKYKLIGKNILEIGCGDAYFLKRLQEKGNNTAIGVDPGFDFQNNTPSIGNHLYLIRDYYSPHFAFLRPDFVMCRLVIDLLEDPIRFIKMLRSNLDTRPNAVVYFEVPDARKTFSESVLWNVVYEHRSWFTPNSLRYLFELCGFKVLNIEPCWQGEFLAIEAQPTLPGTKPVLHDEAEHAKFLQILEKFTMKVTGIQQSSREKLVQIESEGKKLAMWGAGARGVTFLNMFQANGQIVSVVDINPRRHGKYMPGSGHLVSSPESLIDLQPDLILINNPTYADEIKSQARHLGLQADFWVL